MSSDYQERQALKNELFYAKSLPGDFLTAVDSVKPYTMMSLPAMVNAWRTVQFLVHNNIEGSLVECGTWQGGCVQLMAIARDVAGGKNPIIGVDTFDGHPPPGENEIDVWGRSQREIYDAHAASGVKWAHAEFFEVANRLANFESISLIKGPVESVGHLIPRPFAFLRLDMDWYAPTLFSLTTLVPDVVDDGVITIDDYGAHSGCRAATDEWLETQPTRPLIHQLDYSTITFQKK